jgi:hypothetical protein
MLCEVDVLQYYEQFLVLSELMTITGFLTSDERDTAFWCRFHLDDHRVLQPHSLCHGSDGKVPDSAVMTTQAGSILVMDYS